MVTPLDFKLSIVLSIGFLLFLAIYDGEPIRRRLMLICEEKGTSSQLSIPSSSSSKKSMAILGGEAETDKVLHHGYDRFYPMFLEGFRDKPIKLLEIGYLLGHSHNMWLKYFPFGEIYFMEKDGTHHLDKEGFSGDQSKIADLNRLMLEKGLEGSTDVIVDDGSHFPDHQIISFKHLFPKALKPGGVYIIEDIEMNYWRRGETYGNQVQFGVENPNSLMNMLKDLVDVVNREFQPPNKPFQSAFGPEIDNWVSSISFGANCVIIVKATIEEERKYFHREYRHEDKTRLTNLEKREAVARDQSLEREKERLGGGGGVGGGGMTGGDLEGEEEGIGGDGDLEKGGRGNGRLRTRKRRGDLNDVGGPGGEGFDGGDEGEGRMGGRGRGRGRGGKVRAKDSFN